MNSKKKKALKKLLNVSETELNEIIEKVLESWADNIIRTKHQSSKSIDLIIDEVNK